MGKHNLKENLFITLGVLWAGAVCGGMMLTAIKVAHMTVEQPWWWVALPLVIVVGITVAALGIEIIDDWTR